MFNLHFNDVFQTIHINMCTVVIPVYYTLQFVQYCCMDKLVRYLHKNGKFKMGGFF